MFESGDPILLEIAAAIVIGVLITIIYEAKTDSDEKIRELENAWMNLKKRIDTESF